MMWPVTPQWLNVLVDIFAWGVVHATTGYCAHRLSERQLSRDRWILRPYRFEEGGKWYRRRLQIHRWKDSLPEAGDLFPGGMSKRQVPSYDVAGLQLFARETRRAELAHWWALFCGPLFILWNPPVVAGLLITYGVLINLPFIAIQRYNRWRIYSLLARGAR